MGKYRKQEHDGEWQAVQRWWYSRRSAGALYFRPDLVESVHYLGDLPWPRHASLASLAADCWYETKVPMTKLQFAYKFRLFLGIVSEKRKSVRGKFVDWESIDPTYHPTDTRVFYDLGSFRPTLRVVA